VLAVQWNPDPAHHLLAAAVGNKVVLITTGTGNEDNTQITESQLQPLGDLALSPESAETEVDNSSENELDEDESNTRKDGINKKSPMKWKLFVSKNNTNSEEITWRYGAVIGPRIVLESKDSIVHIAWHYKGDYLGVLTSSSTSSAVSIHQVFEIFNSIQFEL
jgi:hypothetical protein